MNSRNEVIDVMKGVLICLVVLGHSGSPLTEFVYVFMVPLFFMLSGYCYNLVYSADLRSLKTLILRRLQSLYLPFVACNAGFAFLHNLFIDIGMYSTEAMQVQLESGIKVVKSTQYYTVDSLLWQIKKILSFTGLEQLAGASWFLRTLFQITIMYGVVDWVAQKFLSTHRNLTHLLVGASLLALGYWYGVRNQVTVGDLEIAFSSYFLFAIGRTEFLRKWSFAKWGYVFPSLIILILLSKMGKVDLALNSYPNPLYLVVASISGWVFVNGSVAKLLVYLKMNAIQYIGRHTLSILFLHFLAFKLVTLVQLYWYGDPFVMLASFPVLRGGWWSLAYCLVGVCVPLGVNVLYLWIKGRFHNQSKTSILVE